MDKFFFGQKSEAPCEPCNRVVTVVYRYRFLAIRGEPKNMLVAVCDKCDHVCLIPHESIERAYS